MEATVERTAERGRTTGLIDTEQLPCLKWALDRPVDALRDELAEMSPVESDFMMLGQALVELDEICADLIERRRILKNRAESLLETMNDGAEARSLGTYLDFRSGQYRSLELHYVPGAPDSSKRVWHQGALKALRNLLLQNPAMREIADKHLKPIEEIKVPNIAHARKAIEALGPTFTETFKLCYDDVPGNPKVEVKTAPLGELPDTTPRDDEAAWTAEVAAKRG